MILKLGSYNEMLGAGLVAGGVGSAIISQSMLNNTTPELLESFYDKRHLRETKLLHNMDFGKLESKFNVLTGMENPSKWKLRRAAQRVLEQERRIPEIPSGKVSKVIKNRVKKLKGLRSLSPFLIAPGVGLLIANKAGYF